MGKKKSAVKGLALDRDAICGLLLEQFLNSGFGSIRSMCQQAYIYGQQEAYQRGLRDGKNSGADGKDRGTGER